MNDSVKRFLGLWGLLIGGLSAVGAAESVGDRPLIPPASTVVLLSSLAGDVESEKSFTDQTRGWLELLEQQTQPPQRVVVLQDGATISPLPTKFPVELHPSTRQEFLSLGTRLTDSSGPLLVVAFGHGGQQGNTPVFHVRGPRLTTADFKAFAERMPAAESNWVLFFRGSGAFAKELAAKPRAILASENDTAFADDPIGSPLLLKTLRANPHRTMTAASEALGLATAHWYSDRHLARTEEPTLRLADEPARVLAGAATPETASATPAEKQKGETESDAAPSELSAAWKSIKRVKPQEFPDAMGVVLSRRLAYTIGSSPALSTEHEEFIQVLTSEGKHLGDFDFSFTPPHENLTFLACEVLRPNGKLVQLDPDAIREAGESAPGDYQAGRRKIFSLPGVGPGAVLHLHYRSDWKTFPMPHVSLTIPLTSELAVNDFAVRVTVGEKMPFHFAFTVGASQDPEIKQGGYGTDYSWHFSQLPAYEREALGPPYDQPAIAISTWKDWAEFADWYSRLIQLTDQSTPELEAKALELTREAKTDREKVHAVYNYVTGLRYVAIPLGVNSFRPHAAASVFKNRYGDCKDKANLLNTLLRAVGVEANLVLVPRFSQAHEEVPGFAFNHAISRVTLKEETLWIDTTDDVCRFGLLPPGDPGRNVLVIDGKTASLTQLPRPTLQEHRLQLSAKLDCGMLDEAVPATIDISTQGFADYEWRSVASMLGGRHRSQSLLHALYHPANGVFALEKQRFTAASALTEPFIWHGSGEYVGIAPLTTTGRTRLLQPAFWLPREWDNALHARNTPFHLNHGYPVVLEESVGFNLTAELRVDQLPPPAENSLPPLRWKLAWSRESDTQLLATLRVELGNGDLTMEETAVLQRQLRALFGSLGRGVSVTGSP